MASIPKLTSKTQFLIQTNKISESAAIELIIHGGLAISIPVGISKNKIFGLQIPSTAALLAFLTPSFQKNTSTDGCWSPTPIIFTSNRSLSHPLSIYAAERAKSAVVATRTTAAAILEVDFGSFFGLWAQIRVSGPYPDQWTREAYLVPLLVILSEGSRRTFALGVVGKVGCVGRGASHCGSRRWVETMEETSTTRRHEMGRSTMDPFQWKTFCPSWKARFNRHQEG